MANIPAEFPTLPPKAVASYDWIDTAEETGIKVFYGISSEDTGGLDYHLIGNTEAYSSQSTTDRTTAGTPKTTPRGNCQL